MSKQASFSRNVGSANALAETALFASRQAWLAGLGAAAVSRQWARDEAGNTFRALVRQGSVVERGAIRVLGDRVESSISTATALWRGARASVLATVNGLAETAVAALPNVRIPAFTATPAAPKRRKAGKARSVKARSGKTVRRVKRAAGKTK
ncbi:MAG TPA: hypothetical protein VGK37_01955 [Casimicrobiaceae bacterium]|jgi:hypothetical protein